MEGEALAEDEPARTRELVLRARQGDERAFADIMRLYGKAVFRLALAVTGNAADAEDAGQEAFLRAFRSLERFDVDRPFGPWIMKIAANRALSRARRRRDEVPLEEALERPEPDERAPGGPESEDLDRMREALRGMGPVDRTVLALRYQEGLPVAEIAMLLGIREGAVKVRLFRARERLMGRLGTGGIP